MDQQAQWQGEFGDEYTARNAPDELIMLNRQDAFREIFEGLDIHTVFEPGCNAGMNLRALRGLGYRVQGSDINLTAIEKAHGKHLEVFNASVYDTDATTGLGVVDCVLSAGLLIHIPDGRLLEALKAMGRATKKWVLLIEYATRVGTQEIEYRGQQGMLWKRNWRPWLMQAGLTIYKTGFLGRDKGFDNCNYYLSRKETNGTV